MKKNAIVFFLKKSFCIIESTSLFMLIPLFSLPFLFISTNVVAQDWEYVRATYNDKLRCDARNGIFLNWAKKIADPDGPLDVCGLAVPDGEVQYEGKNRNIFSLLNWSRPYYEHLTKTIRMHIYAQDLRRGTTIRVGADGSVGGPVEVMTYTRRSNCAEYAIPVAVLEPWGNSFDITVYISDGGMCTERYVARYYFERVSR